jgi:hypothetical protein
MACHSRVIRSGPPNSVEGAARADAALEALNALEGMVHDLEVGREAGAKFWRYFDGIERVLQRIAERDRYYAG